MTFDKDEFGFILGSLKSQAAQLYKLGATRLQVEEAIGKTELNVLRELEEMGYKIIKKKVRIGKNRPHYSYKIELPSKGSGLGTNQIDPKGSKQ